ncbi:MAG: hypothetical protein LR000_00435 [Candidatus Pacebacteria bacterium]|nr:hypothetical protein [Candidatus Paceibacterota bacterium]
MDKGCEENKIKLVLSRDRKETKFSRKARISAARIKGERFGKIGRVLFERFTTYL